MRLLTAQYSTAQYSTAQYSTAQYSTAWYSTAWYSTAQYSPADDAAGVQIKDHSQIEPALTGPDVAYVASPLLIGAIR